MQCFLSPISYLEAIANYVELCLIGLTMTILFVPDLPEPTNRIVSSVSILLAGSEFTFLFGAMPYLSMSVHMAMLKTVTLNFLKSLALYSIYIWAFAFSFYTLFHENTEDAGDSTDKTDNDSSEFKMFSKPNSINKFYFRIRRTKIVGIFFRGRYNVFCLQLRSLHMELRTTNSSTLQKIYMSK